MGKNNDFVKLLLALAAGFLSAYLLTTTTNVLPINYGEKYVQIYNSQPRDRGEKTYINLADGYLFNYPENLFNVQVGYPILIKNNLSENGYAGSVVSLQTHQISTNKMYDSAINLSIARLKKGQSILEYSKTTVFFPDNYRQTMNYKETTVNGHSAVIADFEMSENLYEELNQLGPKKSEVEPLGYKNKTIFIQKDDFVYVFKSGSLFDETEKDIFNKVVYSFRTIY